MRVPSKSIVRRHAADPVVALEHRHAMAPLGKLVGGGEAHRSGADHGRSGPRTCQSWRGPVGSAQPARLLHGMPGMPTPEATALRSRLAAWGFFVLLVALSTRLLASAVRRGVLLTDESPLLYHAATIGFSYFDFGFVRRGLAGSVVSLLGPEPAARYRDFPCALRRRRGGRRRDPVPAPAPARRRTMGLRAAVRRAHVALGRRPGPHRSRRCRAVDRRRAGFSGEATGAVVPVPRAQPGRARDRTRLRAVAARRDCFSIGARWRQVPRRTAAAGLLVLAAFVALYLLLGMLPHADVRDDGSGRAHSFSDARIRRLGDLFRGQRQPAACRPRSARTSAIRLMRLHVGDGLLRDRALHRDPGNGAAARLAGRAAGRRCRRSCFSASSRTTSRAGPCSRHSTSGCCAALPARATRAR